MVFCCFNFGSICLSVEVLILFIDLLVFWFDPNFDLSIYWSKFWSDVLCFDLLIYSLIFKFLIKHFIWYNHWSLDLWKKLFANLNLTISDSSLGLAQFQSLDVFIYNSILATFQDFYFIYTSLHDYLVTLSLYSIPHCTCTFHLITRMPSLNISANNYLYIYSSLHLILFVDTIYVHIFITIFRHNPSQTPTQ